MSSSSLSIRLTNALSLALLAFLPPVASAEDHFLVIAGGYRAASNQVSLEKNVRFFREVHGEVAPKAELSDYFASGNAAIPSVQFEPLDASVPDANELMASLFGSTRYLKLEYRAHELGEVAGTTSRANLARWFDTRGKEMKPGDRLFVYVTAHGGKSREKSRPENTRILLWNQQDFDVKGLQKELVKLPEGVSVVMIMAQCYAGGFAHSVFEGTDPDGGIVPRPIGGFFATVASRQAAGCTAEINEENYDEFSSHFWAAIRGRDRLGREVESADYDGDGIVSLDEAHAYTVLVSRNIDIPIKVSGAFLRERSRFAGEEKSGDAKGGGDAKPKDPDGGGTEGKPELLERRIGFSKVLELAGAADREVLEVLSEDLGLTGEDRYEQAEKKAEEIETQRSELLQEYNGKKGAYDGHRNAIRNDLYGRWPGLANVLTEESVRLLTDDAGAFVDAVKGHARFGPWKEVEEEREGFKDERFDLELQWVRHIRFQRTHNNVVLAENLRRLGSEEDLGRFRLIREVERGGMAARAADGGKKPVSGAE